MVKNILKSLLLVSTLTALNASAWFTWSEDWGNVYIAKINQTDVSPVDHDYAPATHNVEAKLPITPTVRVKESDLWEIAVNVVELQYKNPSGDNIWKTAGVSYSDEVRNYDFQTHQTALSREILNKELDGVSPGDTILIRLYIAHVADGITEHENADKAEDTGPTGDNGWQDPWVAQIELDDTERPTWRNIFNLW